MRYLINFNSVQLLLIDIQSSIDWLWPLHNEIAYYAPARLIMTC